MFLLALTARAGWGLYRLVGAADPTTLEFPDEVDYWSLADSLAAGNGLVGEHGFRALRMPLFPGLLALVAGSENGVVYAKVIQWPIGALAAVLAALLGARLGGAGVGLLAGLLVALDPFLVFFSSLLLTETLFVTTLCALWLAGWSLLNTGRTARPIHWLPVALLAALCVYVRESSIVLVICWTVFLVIRRRLERVSLLGAGLVLLVVIGSLFPWAYRNHRLTGHWCWLTHRGGISLYDGVGPQATGAGDLARIKNMDAVRGLDEAAWNRYFFDRSRQSIRSDPMRILRLAVVKIGRTWNPVPNVDTYQSAFVRWVSAVWMIPVYALALYAAYRLARQEPARLLALLLPALYLLVLHAVFVGSVRYRLGAMPMLEILAAWGCILISRRTGWAGSVPGSPPDP